MVAEYLDQHGFDVRTASGGVELDACLAAGVPELLILDVTMPGEDGFSIARRVRAHSDVAILMLTAAGDVIDRVVGLDLGADDYVTKPFDLRELRARIQSLLRRNARPPPPAQSSNRRRRWRVSANSCSTSRAAGCCVRTGQNST